MGPKPSSKSANDPTGISEHEKISVRPEWHAIDRVKDDATVGKWPDGSPVIFDRSQLSRCDCGILILGNGPCFDCEDLGGASRYDS